MARYEYLWRNKWITSEAETIDDFIETYEGLLAMFKEWRDKGVLLDLESGIGDDYATFYTDNKDLADELGFEEWEYEEDEFYEEEYDEDDEEDEEKEKVEN